MAGKLTVVIATRNDPLLADTVQSIRRGFDGQILIIDDCSSTPITTEGFHDDKLSVRRNLHRLGPGPSRHIGASLIADGWLMFCDSHMEFPHDWYATAIDILDSSDPPDVWGAVYRQSSIDNSFWHDTRCIGGADFYWWRHHDLRFTFVDLLPRRYQHRVEYEVPCVLGGCYFIHTEWFRRIGGYAPFVGYGSEEPWLAWNTHLMGGRVMIMGKLFATHIFQKGSSMKRPVVPEWEVNRLLVAKRVLKHDQYSEFCSWLPIDGVIKDHVEIIAEANKRLFTREFDVIEHESVSHTFSLQSFDEVIELMKEYHDSTSKLCVVCKDRRWIINGKRLVPCLYCNKDGSRQPKINHFTLEPTNE